MASHDHEYYWILFIVATLSGVLLAIFSWANIAMGSARLTKLKYALYACIIIATGSGLLAFDMSWHHRTDGEHVLWGRWVMFGLAWVFITMHMSVSAGLTKAMVKTSGIIAFFFGLMLVFICMTPSHLGHNTYNALILLTVLASVSWLALLLYWVAAVVGFTYWTNAVTSAGASSSALDVDAGEKTTADGTATSTMLVMRVVAAGLTCFWAAIMLVLICVGREGYSLYHNETTQMWLTGAVMVIILVQLMVVHLLVNPDGGYSLGNYRAIYSSPDEPLDGFEGIVTGPEVAPVMDPTGYRMGDKSKKPRRFQVSPGKYVYEGDEVMMTRGGRGRIGADGKAYPINDRPSAAETSTDDVI